MYTTKSRSSFKHSHGTTGRTPPEGPNSGYLVLEDKQPAGTVTACCCWGSRRRGEQLRALPFPQNRLITVKPSGTGKAAMTFFVPVLGQPLSSNRYYVIIAKGRHQGKAYVCAKEGSSNCCCCHGAKGPKPGAFDHGDIYQQIEVVSGNDAEFTSKAVASNAHPPWPLGAKWKAYASKPRRHCSYIFGEALGLNPPLRACLPGVNFPISTPPDALKAVVGKWYVPFVFIEERMVSSDTQMKRAMLYEVTLEQFWEEIYACENRDGVYRHAVEVNALVDSKCFRCDDGREVVIVNKRRKDGLVWFEPIVDVKAREGIGLSTAVWERIVSVEKDGGWVGDDEEAERIVRVEEYGGGGQWSKFACYVLVERFAVRRMDGSLVLTLHFRHLIRLQTKWE